ncbi:MAG: hypothetical protein AMXMBFR59_05600 [Rhodanobacteraceae bacterium]
MKKIQQGFTLIELMIVVAIIAILAAIALPAYQDYTIRAQASECTVLADGSKTAVAEFFTNTGRLPISNTSAGVAQPISITGNYVVSVTVNAGLITCQYGNQANARLAPHTLALSPNTAGGGSITWRCSSPSSMPDKYLPTSCR